MATDRGRELWDEAERLYDLERVGAVPPGTLRQWEDRLAVPDTAALDAHWQRFADSLRELGEAMRRTLP